MSAKVLSRFDNGLSRSVFLCLLACSIPLYYNLQSLSLVALSAFWLISGEWRSMQLKGYYILWMAFFAVTCLGLIRTEHFDAAFNEVTRKLSFLVIPVLFSGRKSIRREELSKAMIAFCTGIALAFFVCLISACIRYSHDGQVSHFFYHSFSVMGASAVYEAWYVIVSIAVLLFFNFEGAPKWFGKARWILLIISTLFLILLASKTLLIIGGLLWITKLIKAGKPFRRTGRHLLWGAVGCTAAVIIAFSIPDSPLSDRYKQFNFTVPDSSVLHRPIRMGDFTNASLRVYLWENALENIEENNFLWTGIGLQNLPDAQAAYYKDEPIEINSTVVLKTYNLHNMYLEVLVTFGVVGLLVFLGVVFYPFVKLNVREAGPALFFYFISAFFFLQESALQTQSGIVFYSFFSCLFYNYYSSIRQEQRMKPASAPLLHAEL